VRPGSVLPAITGQGKTRGTGAILEIDATINQHLAFITLRSKAVLPEYLYRVFVAAYPELRRISEASGSTKGALTCWDIAHFKVPVPPSQAAANGLPNITGH
jgi:type I restriction enzyme S subunit